jgi:hypothetical protein
MGNANKQDDQDPKRGFRRWPFVAWLLAFPSAMVFISGVKGFAEIAEWMRPAIGFIDQTLVNIRAGIPPGIPVPDVTVIFLVIFAPFVLIGVALIAVGRRTTDIFVAIAGIVLLEFGLAMIVGGRDNNLNDLVIFMSRVVTAALIVAAIATGLLVLYGVAFARDALMKRQVPRLAIPIATYLAFVGVLSLPTLLGIEGGWPIVYVMQVGLVFVLPLIAPEALIFVTTAVTAILGGSWLLSAAGWAPQSG